MTEDKLKRFVDKHQKKLEIRKNVEEIRLLNDNELIRWLNV
jgi:hypothetical protein